jgi:hypothetical protein
MKFPKRGPNRLHKDLTNEKHDEQIVMPKKTTPPVTGKLPLSDWKRRWFYSIAAAILASSATAFAQNAPGTPAPSGPVHLPSPAAAQQSAASPVQAEDIHDIRGPISIPYEYLWAAYLVGGLAAAAALYGAWRLYRNRAKERAKLPFEIALEKLEAARALMVDHKVREYAFTVSEIIRVYIEQRFGEKAARRTTEEFLSDLLKQTETPLAQHRRRLEDFLGYCDLMKFARWEASVREMESMHESARTFIIETRPQPESAKAATSAAPKAQAQPELVQTK